MNQTTILNYLSTVKDKYQEEGLIIKALFGSYSRNEENAQSDVDILVEAMPEFAEKYGFGAIARLREIQSEISHALGGISIDFADISGMGKTAKKFIIDRAIYV
ncbi:MAG: Putative nucleotidyltransferase [uncultured Sulfurovum sp.]|uniref:Nucleotidyltransferase n=1 Tax=uncultured Sulfurovum sp. TaxID=269237 RepID=A0A6S6S7U2_9BACT|nr:MAG: Putative nucleotidyltransferase [uncultured Sulfurovum sp.]